MYFYEPCSNCGRHELCTDCAGQIRAMHDEEARRLARNGYQRVNVASGEDVCGLSLNEDGGYCERESVNNASSHSCSGKEKSSLRDLIPTLKPTPVRQN